MHNKRTQNEFCRLIPTCLVYEISHRKGYLWSKNMIPHVNLSNKEGSVNQWMKTTAYGILVLFTTAVSVMTLQILLGLSALLNKAQQPLQISVKSCSSRLWTCMFIQWIVTDRMKTAVRICIFAGGCMMTFLINQLL